MGSGRRSQGRGKDPGRAVADLHRASQLADARRYDEAIPLLRRALAVRDTPALRVALGDCLQALGALKEARGEYERVAASHPPAALRLGLLLTADGNFAAAAPLLRRAGLRDPQACLARAYVALQLGEWDEAEEAAAAAQRGLPDGGAQRVEALLFAGLAQAARGDLGRAAQTLEGVPTPIGRTLAARFHLLGGDLGRALTGYLQLDADGLLPPEELAHAALAATWSSEGERARAWLERAQREAPSVATQLASAQVALAAREPERALRLLPATPHEIPDIADAAMAAVLRARALRQLGRPSELRRSHRALATPVPPRVRALAWVEVGHAEADEGLFETAETAFGEALALDAQLSEARQARELAQKRLSWKRQVEAGAGREIETARAEVEAMRRTFAARESEVAALRRQLALLERGRSEPAPPPASPPDEAKRAALLKDELAEREAEVYAKTEAELERAFGGRVGEAPPALVEIVRQAERMFQKGLQTDLPGAGVAVLFSGALERALYLTVVAELDRSLDRNRTRAAFLEAARSTDRRGRASYRDHFVGAFDREHPQKAPGLGEVARVLRRRSEPHLLILRQFLEHERGWSPAFLDALGLYLEEVKVKLRDPVAHGRVLDIGEHEVAELRSALLHRFAGGEGVLHRLAFPGGAGR